MPFIQFDERGECNYCRSHVSIRSKKKGRESLEKIVSRYRKNSDKPDCLVSISGGRDSSYGLHYVKRVLGLNPIAFTYDWGMVTDLARRNQARMCGKLGVEHIIVSADIRQKRENVRKNIEAWLKKPDLGIVPLWMAGDKQFYYYAHKLRRQTGCDLVISCAGNEFEHCNFKFGFSGGSGVFADGTLTSVPLSEKVRLILYYGSRYLTNPAYLNSSLIDTLHAYFCTFMLPDVYVYLYHYIDWEENAIMATLQDEYGWELAHDTKSTWRIGDGTAPFYNYIYFSVAGFTEFDTFRSKQVREGMLTRNEALALIREDNKPRFESIDWYAQKIGFDCNRAIRIINEMPKRYRML